LGNPIGVIRNDMDVLHQLTATDMVDLAGRMIRNEKKEIIFNFRKTQRQNSNSGIKRRTFFYDWMMNADFALDTKRRLTEIKLSTLKR
jgi:DNA polymerase-3 subunit epsilon